MIYISPIGGLGNNLFQIASLWSLATDNKDVLCLLNINNNVKDLMTEKGRDASNYFHIYNQFINKCEMVKYRAVYPFQYTALKYVNECEYIGYFQCELYFIHRRNEILELFKPTNEILEKVNQYSYLFGNISLHVRRGDYVGSSVHPIQNMKYYFEALSRLPNDIPVLVFSDDIEWCRENFIDKRFIFVDELDYISLYIMSNMKYHIIANSSFSWWGAWLSKYVNKIVIAPRMWFGDNTESDMNLVPSNWIRL